MSARLPPRNVVYPTNAVFRKHKLPPDLWETWSILRAISWVNKYEFTPPVSLPELLALHGGTITTTRALIDRLQKLHGLGWLTANREAGKRNVYYPSVPPDLSSAVCAEGASFSDEESADFPRSNAPADRMGLPTRQPTREVDFTRELHFTGSSTVVVVDPDIKNSDKSVPTTATTSTNTPARARTREDRNHIIDALWDLGIETAEAVDKILGDEPDLFRDQPRDYSHVTPEYVEDWFAHYQEIGRKAGLGAGYYRMQIREKRISPYTMTAKDRAEYRAHNDEEWEREKAARLEQEQPCESRSA